MKLCLIGGITLLIFGIYKLAKYIHDDDIRIQKHNDLVVHLRRTHNCYYKILDLKELYLSKIRHIDDKSGYLIDRIFNMVPEYTTFTYNIHTRMIVEYGDPDKSQTKLADLINLSNLSDDMYVCLNREQKNILNQIKSKYDYEINSFSWANNMWNLNSLNL